MLTGMAYAADFTAGRDAYIRGDFQVAYREFLPLAKEGDAKSRVGVGLLYAKGQGVEQNDVEAHKWFTLAALQKPRPSVFVRTLAVENRKVLTKRMNKIQLAEAKRLVEENVKSNRLASSTTASSASGKEDEGKDKADTSESLQNDEQSANIQIVSRQKIKPSERRSNYNTPISLLKSDSIETRPLSRAKVIIQPKELKEIDQQPFLTRTILPASRNGQTTTIAVIESNQRAGNNTAAEISRKKGQIAETKQQAGRKPQTLTFEKNNNLSILIQLGAFRDSSQSIAARAWNDIIQLHGDLIGKKEAIIVKANLGTKGIFQRLRAGPYPSFDEASGICKLLRTRNQSCFVIRGRL